MDATTRTISGIANTSTAAPTSIARVLTDGGTIKRNTAKCSAALIQMVTVRILHALMRMW